MKVSFYARLTYVTPEQPPEGWPLPPAYYDLDLGRRSFAEGMEQIELADVLGFDWVTCSEHHYTNGSLCPAPALLAGSLIGRLKHAKLAMLGHLLPLNNPVRVAEELAMLDNLSGGRLIVGFLRGAPNEHQAYTLNPTETRERSQESMELILKAWTEPQPFGWEGRYFQYRTVSVWPRPLQQPIPPSYVVGSSPDSVAFAARNRLGLGFAFNRFDTFTEMIAGYRAQCAAHGWQPSPEHLLYRGRIYVAETDEAAQEDVRLYWEKNLRNNFRRTMSTSIVRAVATVDARISAIAGLDGARASGDQAEIVRFVGSPATVLAQLKECREVCGAGVVDLLFQGPDLAHDKTLRSIELFAKEVLPHLRDL